MELCAEIAVVVRRHLVAARDSLDGLIGRLDASGADLATQTSASQPPAKEIGAGPTVITAEPTVKLSRNPETIARRERKKRQRQAKTANGKANPDEPEPPAPSDWPALRQEFREVAAARGLVVSQIARQIGLKQGSLGTWLSRDAPAPGPDTIARLRAWIAAEPVIDSDQGAPPFTLSETEKTTLSGHLSLVGSAKEIRDFYGVTREVAESAASGAHLHADIISRLRGALLANGAAAE